MTFVYHLVQVAGIIGFDVLSRAMIEIPARDGGISGKNGGICWVGIFKPREAEELPDSEQLLWHPLRMIARVPHVQVRFKQCPEHGALFLMDTGARGVDLMFHSRAVKQLALATPRMRHVNLRGMGAKVSIALPR